MDRGRRALSRDLASPGFRSGAIQSRCAPTPGTHSACGYSRLAPGAAPAQTALMKRWRGGFLLAAVLAMILATILAPRVSQSQDYHRLADVRTLLGVRNALNVLSNIPFALVGLFGMATLARAPGRSSGAKPGYLVFFAGVLLTAFGSAYYHAAPGDGRLVWDRLPMTLAFAGLLSGLLAERVDRRLGRALLAPLVVLGVGSVLYWRWTELRGLGDLRPYALLQFGPIVLLPLILVLYPGRPGSARWLMAAFFLYALAKVCEAADAPIFALGLGLSGHTLKHLVAAAGILCVERSLRESPGWEDESKRVGSPSS